MKPQPLTIRRCGIEQRDAVAWYIPGAAAAAWLDELLAWNVPHETLTLCIIPTSGGDRTPQGVLVIPPPGSAPQVSPRCLGYGKFGQNLYLPVEAAFHPAVEPAELESAGESQSVRVWHPAAGLVEFEPADLLGVGDLIAPPPVRDGMWNLAQPGETFSCRLLAVEAAEQPSVETIIEQGQDDIGSRGKELKRLPRRPGESQLGNLGRAALAPLTPLASLAKWMASFAPKTAQHETWINHVERWANRVLGSAANLFSARQRELERLLHLLATNPDEGLKYAPPMKGGPHRGRTEPSGRLGRRDVDFNLNRLAGGGPADVWDIDPQLHARLMAHYRELAGREIRLGRYRRAAYIYAELLGDLEAAAAALKSARFYREAAVLYQHRLNRPLEAADCLAEGGLFDEAIRLYEELQRYEQAGELYAKLERMHEARQAFRKAVDVHERNRRHLDAARLLDEKLQDPDAALGMLRAGWPDSPHAGACLSEFFRMLGAHGRHHEAGAHVGQLREAPLAPMANQLLVDGLVGAALTYPDDSVRSAAADATRVVVSRRLLARDRGDESQLLAAIGRLAPHDRLLERDCQRFLRDRRPVAKPTAKPQLRRSAVNPPELVHTIKMLPTVEWLCAASTGESYYVAGYWNERDIVLASGSWRMPQQEPALTSWRFRRPGPSPILLAPHLNDAGPIWIRMLACEDLWQQQLFRSQQPSGQESAGTPPCLDRTARGVTRAWNGTAWVVKIDEGVLTLCGVDREGVTISSQTLAGEYCGGQWDEQPIPLFAGAKAVYLGLEHWLVGRDAQGLVSSLELPGPIRRLCGSGPHMRPRVIIGLERGGAVLWENSGTLRLFGEELDSPVLAFDRAGRIIAAAARQCHIYRTNEERLILESSFKFETEFVAPIAALETHHRDQFALCDAAGRIDVYEFTGR